jgi:hypothetical protein
LLSVAAVLTIASGGRVSMTITGAKSGSVEMRDAGFCNTSASLGRTTMHIFAFTANNSEWAVTIGSTNGMPKAGSHKIAPSHPADVTVTARLIDKTVGKSASEWVRYEASAGTVTFSRVDSTHVAGSFRFTAKPTWPAPGGKAVTADGTFDGSPADGCADAARPRK